MMDQAVVVNRRRFLGQVVLGVLTAPLAAKAQQAERAYRVGLVSLAGDPQSRVCLDLETR
jgi:hypothetical protein